MTYKELYDKALWDLEHNNMTLGEFEEVTEPLNKEIPKEEQTDGDLISRKTLLKELSVVQNRPVHTAMTIIKCIPTVNVIRHTDGDLITEIDKLPRIKVGNSNSPTVKYCIDERLIYEVFDRHISRKEKE